MRQNLLVPRDSEAELLEKYGKFSELNTLNDFRGKQWIKFAASFFSITADSEREYRAEGLKAEHPGTYPKKFVERMLSIYSQRGHTILDPMMGTGTTGIQSALMGRRFIGFDLNAMKDKVRTNGGVDYVDLELNAMKATEEEKPIDYIDVAKKSMALYGPTDRPHDFHEPSFEISDALEGTRDVPSESVHYTLFSPPYVDFLHRSSGGVITRSKRRKKAGKRHTYSDHPGDIGNVDYEMWLAYLINLAREIFRVTIPGRYMTIVVQNEMRVYLNPIAWRLALAIEEQTGWVLKPEQIWAQEEKKNTIFGWPTSWIVDNHHHYCLNFYKMPAGEVEPPSSQVLWHCSNLHCSVVTFMGAKGDPCDLCGHRPNSGLEISKYRYTLRRTFDGDKGKLVWIMLNPSTADDVKDDTTITRCMGFASDWGYGEMEVVNLFGLRATDPKVLKASEEPVGTHNDRAIMAAVESADLVVAAWGHHGGHLMRYTDVLTMIDGKAPLMCLGTTKLGHPKHPARLAASTPLEEFRGWE